MKFNSILREAETREFAKLTLSGEVLDLGGVKDSAYLKLVQGDFHVTSVNIGKDTGCDIIHNLEVVPLPFSNETYDAVVLNNTLEHIYHARELVMESVRVLKKGGKIIITVPFLFPEHPSPSDYWRFTEEAIQDMLKEAGISKIMCKALGTGVSTVSFHFFERLLPYPLKVVSYLLRPVVHLIDSLFYSFRKKGSLQKMEYYTLGYFVVGTK